MTMRIEVLHEHGVVNARPAPDRPREQLHRGHRVGMICGMEAITDGAEHGLPASARADGMALAPVAFEDRLRRLADRRGLILSKSRARDPGSLTYGGYRLVNQETGGIDFGYGNAGRSYAATLEGIEQYLSTD